MRWSAAIGIAVWGCVACTPPAGRAPQFDETAWRNELETWKSERAARLAAPDGWLTVVALDWLEPGENRVGSAADARVRLPADRVPEWVGSLWLENGAVRLEPAPGGGLRVGGQPAEPGVLASDAGGKPDVLEVADLSFHVLARGERLGVRVKDPQAAARREFRGLEYYPVDPAYRVVGRLRRGASPVEIDVPNVLGTVETMRSPGVVDLQVRGERISLVPVQSDPQDPQLWFILRDATSGHGTYPAGRFLYGELLPGDEVLVDFNRAYNPPCAFTPHATCPLPPRDNWLSVAIEAGEKDFGHHDGA